jgi:sulfatase modifying factor 1
MSNSCCSPQRLTPETTSLDVHLGQPTSPTREQKSSMARIPGGTFNMGDAFAEGYPSDGEAPVHRVDLEPFLLATAPVTNAEFTVFAESTKYQTDAERFGSSAVFHLQCTARPSAVMGRVTTAPWWLEVRDASWRQPGGEGSSTEDLADHPVVHVSWNDAQAYCAWSGLRLPTEAEWERGARGGLERNRFPWGDERQPRGVAECNIWTGRFPTHNDLSDGYLATAPARSFRPNEFGLFNVVGNVWEWCSDFFSADYYRVSPLSNPSGPEQGEARVMRGGSFLCHDSYCSRYRVAARSSNTAESSTSNLGFRCAAPNPKG